jgi:hypothetical protein
VRSYSAYSSWLSHSQSSQASCGHPSPTFTNPESLKPAGERPTAWLEQLASSRNARATSSESAWATIASIGSPASLQKFNGASVNREALRARLTVIASTCRAQPATTLVSRATLTGQARWQAQSSRLARQRGYSVKTVRESSVAGPCITLGLVLRETDRRISYCDRHGTPKFISRRWAIHTEPCPSCPDHPKTKYRDG